MQTSLAKVINDFSTTKSTHACLCPSYMASCQHCQGWHFLLDSYSLPLLSCISHSPSFLLTSLATFSQHPFHALSSLSSFLNDGTIQAWALYLFTLNFLSQMIPPCHLLSPDLLSEPQSQTLNDSHSASPLDLVWKVLQITPSPKSAFEIIIPPLAYSFSTVP